MTASRANDQTLSACTCFRLRRAARRVSQLYDQALAPAQVSLNEYSILRHARGAPRGIAELAALLGMDRTTLTRNLKPLVRKGWLATGAGTDARQTLVAITDQGRGVLAAARPHWRRAQAQLRALHGEAGVDLLDAQLDALERALRVTPAAPAARA